MCGYNDTVTVITDNNRIGPMYREDIKLNGKDCMQGRCYASVLCHALQAQGVPWTVQIFQAKEKKKTRK